MAERTPDKSPDRAGPLRRRTWLLLLALLVTTLLYLASSWLTGHLAYSEVGSSPGRAVLRLSAKPSARARPPPRLQHLAVAVAVASPNYHVAEFLSFLLPSWEYITSLPEARGRIVDLLVFCETTACPQLPSHCLPMVGADGLLFQHDDVPNCWQHLQPPHFYQEWKEYLYMTSIAFATEPPFTEVAGRYDLILRTDQDAFVTPKLLTWQPPHGMAFGWVSHTFGNSWTETRLKEVAKRAGYTHRGMHEICSGWLAPANYTMAFAQHTLRIGRYMLENEYGPDKPGLEKWGEGGSWPEWWRGVTSLYAAEIAINHLVPGINMSYSSGHEIDEPTYSDSPLHRHVHLHCIHGDGRFTKHEFRGERKAEALRPWEARLGNLTKLPVITPDMPVRDYAAAIAWRSFHLGMAVTMRKKGK